LALLTEHNMMTGLGREIRGVAPKPGPTLTIPKKQRTQTSTKRGLRRWQQRLLDGELKKRNRHVKLCAPTASGKGYAIKLLATFDIVQSLFARKVLIVVPNTAIGANFTRNGKKPYDLVPIDGTDRTWQPLYDFCTNDATGFYTGEESDRERSGKCARLLSFLQKDMTPSQNVFQRDVRIDQQVAVCTMSLLVYLWKELGKTAEGREMQKTLFHNTTVFLDEAHHCLGAFDEDGDSLTEDEKKKLIASSTEIGKIIHAICNSEDETVRLVLVTATFFRSDQGTIVDDGLDGFVTYYCTWSEFWEMAQFEVLKIHYETFTDDRSGPYKLEGPMDKSVDRIQDMKDRKHMVYFPPVDLRFGSWITKDSVKRFKAALKKAWPGVRILDLVDQDPETRRANMEALNNEPKHANDGESQYDVVLLCGIEEGLDWVPGDTLHSLKPPRALTKAVQRNGRIFRIHDTKRSLEIFNYINACNNAKDEEELKDMLEEVLAAVLIGTQVSEIQEEIFIPIISGTGEDKKKRTSMTLKEIFGNKYGGVIKACAKGYAALTVKERKDFQEINWVAQEIANNFTSPRVTENLDAVVDGLILEMLRINTPREAREKIGLNLKGLSHITKLTWNLLMAVPGAAEHSAFSCSVDADLSERLHHTLRQVTGKYTEDEGIEAIRELYAKRMAS
jgi:hypothetical protein